MPDKPAYINKAADLLEQKNTYRTLSADPASKHKNKLLNILKTIKHERGLGDNTYKRLYPTGAGP